MAVDKVAQRAAALERANAIRYARADLKKAIAEGKISLGEALLMPEAQGMSVTSVLEAQHRWGHVRAEKCCRSINASPWSRVEHLSLARRKQLAMAAAMTPVEGRPSNTQTAA